MMGCVAVACGGKYVPCDQNKLALALDPIEKLIPFRRTDGENENQIWRAQLRRMLDTPFCFYNLRTVYQPFECVEVGNFGMPEEMLNSIR